ncbi:hypothetical protein ACLOJK_031482 [Asimina triloba]
MVYILCTAFSTTSALTDWSSVFYSVIYTSVPTIVVGILDKDLSHKTLLQNSQIDIWSMGSLWTVSVVLLHSRVLICGPRQLQCHLVKDMLHATF